jgi:hypothetical protein
MRKLFLILALCLGTIAQAQVCNGVTYGFRVKLGAVDHTKVPSNQTNIIVPFAYSATWLKTAANGGQVQNTVANWISDTVPADLCLASSSSGGTVFKYRLGTYSATGGSGVFYIKFASLSSTVDQPIWAFTNNAAVTTLQEDVTMYSDAGVVAAFSFPDGTTLSGKDASGNSNDLTLNSATATAGLVDGAAVNSTRMARATFTGQPTGGGSRFVFMTIKPSALSGIIFCYGNDSGSPNAYGLYFSSSKLFSEFDSGLGGVAGATTMSTGTWYSVGARYDNVTNKVFLNGAQDGTVNYSSGATTAGVLNIGQWCNNSSTQAGTYDEALFFNVAPSADYIATLDHAYRSPSTFVIAATPLTITTTALSDVTYYNISSYSQTLTASGGTAPYTWSISSGSLPTGLSLNSSTGVISGSVTGTTQSFTVMVTDADSTTTTKPLSITVQSATCGSGYSFSRQVILSRAQNADQTNYPFMMNLALTNSSLQTAFLATGSGGSVQHTTTNSIGRTIPADVVICPDNTTASLPLKYEIENYSSTVAGKGIIHVLVKSYTVAANVSVYVYIGNASVTTSQEDLTMWSDINCVAIWHLPDGTTLDAKDSCPTNSLNGTVNGTVTATSEPIGGSATFAGATSSNITFGGTTNYALVGSPLTVSWWGKPTFGNAFPDALLLHSDDGVPLQLGYSNTCGSYCGVLIGSSNNWARLRSNVVPPTLDYSYTAISYNGSGSGNIANFDLLQDFSTGTWAAAGAFGAVTNENKIGSSSSVGNAYGGVIDELRVFSDQKSMNWRLNDWYNQITAKSSATSLSWKRSSFVVIDPSYTGPSIRQWAACNTQVGCPMTAPYQSGNLLIVGLANTDSSCGSSTPVSALGLTFTLRVSAADPGTIHNYQSCIFTAPISSSSIDTITLPGSNSAAVVLEMVNVATTSVATATSGTNTGQPPTALSATSSSANSFLVCVTRNTVTGAPPPIVPNNSQGYAAIQTGYDGVTDHPSAAYLAYGTVGAGSKGCTLDSGNGDVMAIFGPAAASTVRHRSKVY